jgi:hypothetical protein
MSERPSEYFVVDRNSSGDVIGVEILSLDHCAIGQARRYAAQGDLSFPHELQIFGPEAS